MKEVLAKIKPSKEEEKQFQLIVASFLEKLNRQLKKAGLSAKALLGGSGAKGTWISPIHDVDIFVLFEFKKYSVRSSDLSLFLEPVIKRSFPEAKIERLHGSRDYFRFKFQSLNFEVVPILEIRSADKALNITDVSPLHVKWVNKNTHKLKDEILLAKKFFQSNNLYGAESHIKSFSGYSLEILIYNYGSLNNLLKAALKWKIGTVIDVSRYYKNPEMAVFHLNKSKINSPLILIDPVDKDRNALAALSLEKFELLKKKAAEYLKKPHPGYFEKKEIYPSGLKQEAAKKKLNLVYLEVQPLKGKEDVSGAKILKVFNFLKISLSNFLIEKAGWDFSPEKARLYFFLKRSELPEYVVRKGPPIKMKDHVADFRKKNQIVYEEKGHLFAKVKLKNPQLKDFVADMLKQEYLTEKVRKVLEKSIDYYI